MALVKANSITQLTSNSALKLVISDSFVGVSYVYYLHLKNTISGRCEQAYRPVLWLYDSNIPVLGGNR